MGCEQSQRSFWHGCNYPWSTDGTTIFYGLDFGANIWGSHLGVSTRRVAIQRDFHEMASLGFTVARWFVFGDGRAGIIYDAAGLPAGIDAHFFADLDAACEIARDVEIQLHLVLLDHRWMFEGVRETIADPSTGALLDVRLPHGRSHVLQTARGRAALFAHVFEPLVRRYGAGGERSDLSQQMFAFELMNEPDFIVEEWEDDVSSHCPRPLAFDVLANMVADFSNLVHRRSSAVTTIGCARPHNLWAWDDPELRLDVLQVHSYPDARRPGRDVDVLNTSASSLGVRRPVLLGEFPGNPSGQYPPGASPLPQSIEDVLEAALAGGYVGSWPWSFSGTDAYGRLPAEALRHFAARHPNLVNQRAIIAHE